MNRLIRRLLLILGFSLGAAALHGATPVIGTQLFQDTNARIDDLFRYRLTPPKPPGPSENPFRPMDTPIVNQIVPSDSATGPVVRESQDQSVLRIASARLSFGGLLTVGGKPMVVINKVSYKEGSIIVVRIQGSDVYLRVVALTKNSIILGLNDARLTLNF